LEISADPKRRTWIVLLNSGDAKSAIDAYIASASWALTTVSSVGYGDIYPLTNEEKIFGVFALMCACGIFSYIVGVMSTLFDKNNLII
jgi:hypothetical protein